MPNPSDQGSRPSPAPGRFGALILAQAVHSCEEYLGRLWDAFPPARFVGAMISVDLERGFILTNIALVTFGLWCWLWPVRRRWPSAAPIAAGWALLEGVNGVVHLLWALGQGRYEPGVVTAPVLLVLAIYLSRQLGAPRAAGAG